MSSPLHNAINYYSSDEQEGVVVRISKYKMDEFCFVLNCEHGMGWIIAGESNLLERGWNFGSL